MITIQLTRAILVAAGIIGTLALIVIVLPVVLICRPEESADEQ